MTSYSINKHNEAMLHNTNVVISWLKPNGVIVIFGRTGRMMCSKMTTGQLFFGTKDKPQKGYTDQFNDLDLIVDKETFDKIIDQLTSFKLLLSTKFNGDSRQFQRMIHLSNSESSFTTRESIDNELNLIEKVCVIKMDCSLLKEQLDRHENCMMHPFSLFREQKTAILKIDLVCSRRTNIDSTLKMMPRLTEMDNLALKLTPPSHPSSSDSKEEIMIVGPPVQPLICDADRVRYPSAKSVDETTRALGKFLIKYDDGHAACLHIPFHKDPRRTDYTNMPVQIVDILTRHRSYLTDGFVLPKVFTPQSILNASLLNKNYLIERRNNSINDSFEKALGKQTTKFKRFGFDFDRLLDGESLTLYFLAIMKSAREATEDSITDNKCTICHDTIGMYSLCSSVCHYCDGIVCASCAIDLMLKNLHFRKKMARTMMSRGITTSISIGDPEKCPCGCGYKPFMIPDIPEHGDVDTHFQMDISIHNLQKQHGRSQRYEHPSAERFEQMMALNCKIWSENDCIDILTEGTAMELMERDYSRDPTSHQMLLSKGITLLDQYGNLCTELQDEITSNCITFAYLAAANAASYANHASNNARFHYLNCFVRKQTMQKDNSHTDTSVILLDMMVLGKKLNEQSLESNINEKMLMFDKLVLKFTTQNETSRKILLKQSRKQNSKQSLENKNRFQHRDQNRNKLRRKIQNKQSARGYI